MHKNMRPHTNNNNNNNNNTNKFDQRQRLEQPPNSDFLGRHGFGANGRMLGISKMFQERDTALLKTQTAVVTVRPRGVLSGFLVIAPGSKAPLYVPPVTGGRVASRSVWMRLDAQVYRDGAILSCYWSSTNELVLEDILVWEGVNVWRTMNFGDRWRGPFQAFCSTWQPDTTLQGCPIRVAEYMSLQQFAEGGHDLIGSVFEFVWLEGTSTAQPRRLIWVPSAYEANSKESQSAADEKTETFVARREAVVGPDIFTLWKEVDGGHEKQNGVAYIRTLAMSRLLRLHPVDEFRVRTNWNRMFERHEIVGIQK